MSLNDFSVHPHGERPASLNGDGAGRVETQSPPTGEPAPDSAGRFAVRANRRRLLRLLAELNALASLYVAARIDAAKASARGLLIRMTLEALGFVAIGALLVVAIWFVLSGVAQGLGRLFGEQAWIGATLTGLAALAVVAAGLRWSLAAGREAARERTVDKYETRRAHVRARFGPEAEERRTPPASDPRE